MIRLLLVLATFLNTALSYGLDTTVVRVKADSARKLKIVTYKLHEEIAPQATRRTQRAFEMAAAEKADLIILDMDTYGGSVPDADKIRTQILESKIPVWVFIRNNGASAGAVISIACHKIFMTPAASIGAATVVDQEGKRMDEKYQSYMRGKVRATAVARGRNPDVAEAMMDEKVIVKGLNDSGKIVTLTADEAIAWGFCEGKFNTIEAMLKENGVSSYDLKESEISVLDKVISWLVNPAVSGILILMILGGIYFELQSPGIGFPLIVAITGAVLYFAPLYLEGLAANWEILVFIAGIILLGFEIFVIPGFGVTGILGIICVVGGLILSLVANVDFDFGPVSADQTVVAFSTVLASVVVFMVALVALGGSIYKLGAFKKIMSHGTLSDARVNIQGNELHGVAELVGAEAVTITDLRPQGRIRVDNQVVNASSFGGFIPKDSPVVIADFRDGIYWVNHKG